MRGKIYVLKKTLAFALSAALLFGEIELPARAAENDANTLPEVVTEAIPVYDGNDANGGLNTGMTISGTDSLGTFLADALSGTMEDFRSTPGSHVLSLEAQKDGAEKLKVKAEYESLQDCILVVGVYDVTGTQFLCSGNARVAAKDTEAELEIEGTVIPDYFILKGYLVENDTYRPLCSEFNCTLYTEAMQKLLKLKATDDEVKGRVYNLDESDEENFVVYKEETISVAAGDNANILKSSDDEKLEYTFKAPDETLCAVKPGAILSYQYAAC